jgi:hypothetical protein
MLIEPSSTEYILIPVTGPQDDLSIYGVEVALTAEGVSDQPVPGDWKTGTWLPVGSAKEAALLHRPGDYPAGQYMAWARVTASPEQVVLRAGRVRIGDTRP